MAGEDSKEWQILVVLVCFFQKKRKKKNKKGLGTVHVSFNWFDVGFVGDFQHTIRDMQFS